MLTAKQKRAKLNPDITGFDRNAIAFWFGQADYETREMIRNAYREKLQFNRDEADRRSDQRAQKNGW